jgi:multicomponent K+:H+ antiporter subunit E
MNPDLNQTPAPVSTTASTTTLDELKPRRWFPHKMLSVYMVIVWLLLNNSIAPGQILLGAFLAWLIPWATQAFWPEALHIRKPLLVIKMGAIIFYDIIIANLNLAVRILGPVDKLQPAFVKVPLDIDHDFTIALLASIISLTPGTVSADLSKDGRYLLLHCLHVIDVDAEIRLVKQRYEAPLKEIFEC